MSNVKLFGWSLLSAILFWTCLLFSWQMIPMRVPKADSGSGTTFMTKATPEYSVGTIDNFPKTINLPKTSSFITLFPGQSAEGTIKGMAVKLSVDADLSPNLNGVPGRHYSYHMYINGVESESNLVGDVLIAPWNQNADGSTRWNITYPDPGGRYYSN